MCHLSRFTKTHKIRVTSSFRWSHLQRLKCNPVIKQLPASNFFGSHAQNLEQHTTHVKANIKKCMNMLRPNRVVVIFNSAGRTLYILTNRPMLIVWMLYQNLAIKRFLLRIKVFSSFMKSHSLNLAVNMSMITKHIHSFVCFGLGRTSPSDSGLAGWQTNAFKMQPCLCCFTLLFQNKARIKVLLTPRWNRVLEDQQTYIPTYLTQDESKWMYVQTTVKERKHSLMLYTSI